MLKLGELFEWDLHWTVQHPVTDDFTMFLRFFGHTGQAVAVVNTRPLEVTIPMNGSEANRSLPALCLISLPVFGRGLTVLSW